MNPAQINRREGAALVELLCASALAVLVLAATLVTFIAVQRSFMASLYQVDSQTEQNRVAAYLRRDLRGASAVQISSQGTQITVSVAAQNASILNLNLGASLLSLLNPAQATATSTIRYYREGTAIIREVDGVATELSASATKFHASLQGSLVQIDTGFLPRFTFGNKSATPAVSNATALVHLLNSTTH